MAGQRIPAVKGTRDVLPLDTYKKAGKASSTVEDNIKNVDLEIAAQEELLKAKRGEVGGINAKYDADKKRYGEATAKAASTAKK